MRKFLTTSNSEGTATPTNNGQATWHEDFEFSKSARTTETPRTEPQTPPESPHSSASKLTDRRQATRYGAVLGRGWLGWHDGSRFVEVPAWILDIGMGGCLVAANEIPPAQGSVWVRLDDALLPHWFETKLHDVRPGTEVHALRLTFPASCPYELFMAVAYGRISSSSAKPSPANPGRSGFDHSTSQSNRPFSTFRGNRADEPGFQNFGRRAGSSR